MKGWMCLGLGCMSTAASDGNNASMRTEQAVNDNWRAGEYVLDADNFSGVEFEAFSA